MLMIDLYGPRVGEPLAGPGPRHGLAGGKVEDMRAAAEVAFNRRIPLMVGWKLGATSLGMK